MADVKNTKNQPETTAGESQVLSDLQRLQAYIIENPKQVAAIVVVVILAVLAGLGFRAYSQSSKRTVMTEYAAAQLVKEPAERLRALGAVLDSGAGSWTAEVLYMMAETAVEAKEYDKARDLFNRVRSEFPQTEFTSRAVFGLAFLDENAGKNEEALKGYQELRDKWATSLEAKRAPLSMGRVYESLGQLDKAVAAYTDQGKVFAGSAAAQQAEMNLARLKSEHPELFPKEAPKSEGEAALAPASAKAEGEATPAPAPAAQ